MFIVKYYWKLRGYFLEEDVVSYAGVTREEMIVSVTQNILEKEAKQYHLEFLSIRKINDIHSESEEEMGQKTWLEM